MFSFQPTEHEETDLDVVITELIAKMSDHEGHTKEYTAMTDNLKTLIEARKLEVETESLQTKTDLEVQKAEAEINARKTVSADTIALIGANLAGILMILSYEHANVITSKAIQQISKIRL